MANYSISNIYSGGYSSIDPTKSPIFTGYKSDSASLGMSTDARTANVLQEVSAKISSGAKTIELNQVFPEIFDSTPKEQLEEVHRLSKLTGVDMTFHAPIVGLDPSGIDRQGNFSDLQREAVEREMIQAVERIQAVRPEGGMPITFHAAEGVPTSYIEKAPTDSKEAWVVNVDTKALARLPLKKRHFTGGEKPEEVDLNKELNRINRDQWVQSLQNLAYYAEVGEDLIKRSEGFNELIKGEKLAGKELTEIERDKLKTLNRGVAHLQDSYRRLQDFYELAFKHTGDKEDKEKLLNFYNQNKDKIQKIEKNPFDEENIRMLQSVVDEGFDLLSKGIKNPPRMFMPVNEFIQERAAKTFGNVAFETYKKFGDKSPVISIENSYAGMAASTGEELKSIIDASKKEFVNHLVDEKKFSESEANKIADKMVGATWDVGRLNTLRKHGFTREEIIQESEKIAPVVKHVHLSDNFGMESTEIPMGMGNVPIKEIMEKLGKEGFEGKKVLEAMHWWQHFKSPPMRQTFEAFGAPIYSEGVGPVWGQEYGFHQDYYSGVGPIFPNVHFQTFGAGFSQLPLELGGQMPGAQGRRTTGIPME